MTLARPRMPVNGTGSLIGRARCPSVVDNARPLFYLDALMRSVRRSVRAAVLILAVVTVALPGVLPVVDAREPVTGPSIESHHDPASCFWHHDHEACLHLYGAAPMPSHRAALSLRLRAERRIVRPRARRVARRTPFSPSSPRAPPRDLPV